MRKEVGREINKEWAPIAEIEVFKTYQTREEFAKDYDTSNYTELDWYNPAYYEKAWIDPTAARAISEGKLYKGFEYLIVNDRELKLEQIILPAMIAGRINIPPKKAANEVPAGGGSIPTPVRPLTENEFLERISPFSIRVVNRTIREAMRGSLDQFTKEDRRLLKEIHTMLQQLTEVKS